MTTVSRESYLRCKHQNSLNHCSLPGCGRPRTGLNAWCRQHLDRARQYGHPSAQPFRPSAWTSERKEVSSLLASNADHPGLLQVCQFLADWMARAAADGHAFKGAQEVARLVRHGVTALQVVTEVAAFVLWHSARPTTFPTDRAVDFALSRAVFMLAPRERRVTRTRGISGTWGMKASGRHSYSPKPRPSALAHVGRFLREALAAFLANVRGAVEQRRAVKRDPLALHRLPFAV